MKGKSYVIPKRLLWEAWLKVKENGGAAGADGVTIEQFEEDLSGNVFKLWNRMSSGSYLPGAVRAAETPKKGEKGGVRVLGIPNVADRIAQTAAAIGVGARRGADLRRGLPGLPPRASGPGSGRGLPTAVLEE